MTSAGQEPSTISSYHGVKVLTTVLSSMCMLTVAMTLGLGHLYMMAVAIAAVPLVSYAVGKRMLTGLSVRREVVDVAWDGQPARVKLHFRNQSNLPNYFLQAQDTLPQGVKFLDGDGIIPVAVPPRGTQVAEYGVVFPHRGRYRVGPLNVRATDPLGMFFFSQHLGEQAEVTVLPTPLPIPPIESFRGAPFTMAGVHSAPIRGDSVEFLGIREYTSGDPLRRVDWKHSARYGELFVRDFERFTQTEICIVLDCSASTHLIPNSFEVMIKAVSGALHLAYYSGIPFRLVLGIPEVDSRPASWSSDQLYEYLYALVDVAPRSDVSWHGVVARSASQLPPGALLMLVTASADSRVLPVLSTCYRRLIQVVALLPNVPALDSLSGFLDALHDGEFMRALSAHNAVVIPLHLGESV